MKFKRRLPSIVMYVMSIGLLMIPWITINNMKINIYQFIYKMNTLELLDWGMKIEAILFVIYTVFSIIYLILMIMGKRTKLNVVSIILGVAIVYIHTSEISLGMFVVSFLDQAIPISLMIITCLEFPIREMSERFDETVTEAYKYRLKELELKDEEKRRLQFEGKYSRLFYLFVWKNFKHNWKDYLLLLGSNIMIFACAVIGFGMKDLLAAENTTKGTQLFNGLNRILVNSMIPLTIIAIFIYILLFFHYIKSRARNFGIFLTLGMRRNMLYRFVALEYLSVFLFSLLCGGLFGYLGLSFFVRNSLQYVGISLSISKLGLGAYVKSIGIIIIIAFISLLAAKEIFRDFNVGRNTDLHAIGEKLPRKFRKIFIIIGIIFIGFSVFRYQNLDHFEKVLLVLVFFIGMFLIIRYGMADYLIQERKSKKYIHKLLIHNQLFHKSKTSAGYIGVFFIIHFSILFYFVFQIISTNTAEDIESLYPYDIVCLADENDNLLLNEINEKFDVLIREYPALRVSAYDSTEKLESYLGGTKAIQGQHIGISESTYHELKKNIDSNYKYKDLELDEKGTNIHIVYQQDKSEHAKPTDFYIPRSKPLLHIGQPCRGAASTEVMRSDVGYRLYEVKSEERGSLIGVFQQGMKENIIVFSDEYFETIKDLWKTTHIFSGMQIENEAERIPGFTIHQGITKLVLMNAAVENLAEIEEYLNVFEERHLEEEKELFKYYFMYQGIYDLSVSYHYMKNEAITNLQTERVMKITMNSLVIIVFFLINIMLMIIKMLSEMDVNKKRTEFYLCMGMNRKNRIKNQRTILFRYYFVLPLIISLIFAVIFTVCTMHARLYEVNDMIMYVQNMAIIWTTYIGLNALIIWSITTIYAYRMEAAHNERTS